MKRLGVDKANARIVAVTAIAAFLSIFFLVGSYTLIGQLRYQNRVISAKKTAVNQLKTNIGARDSLVKSYNSFASATQNFIGGSSSGGGPQDGSNPVLVLDALPSTYDFPALTTTLEKLASDQHVTIDDIEGSDDSAAQSAPAVGNPQPVEMPFVLKVSGDYNSILNTVNAFDRSIRPIQFTKLVLTGATSDSGTPTVSAEMDGSSYYQAAKTLNIKKKVVQ